MKTFMETATIENVTYCFEKSVSEEDRVYWGHIEWEGWDAYVPMYYMEKVA